MSNKNENETSRGLVRAFFEQIGIEELFKILLDQLQVCFWKLPPSPAPRFLCLTLSQKHAESTKILLPAQASQFTQPQPPVSSQPTQLTPFAEELILLSDAFFYLLSSFPPALNFLAKSLDFLLLVYTSPFALLSCFAPLIF